MYALPYYYISMPKWNIKQKIWREKKKTLLLLYVTKETLLREVALCWENAMKWWECEFPGEMSVQPWFTASCAPIAKPLLHTLHRPLNNHDPQLWVDTESQRAERHRTCTVVEHIYSTSSPLLCSLSPSFHPQMTLNWLHAFLHYMHSYAPTEKMAALLFLFSPTQRKEKHQSGVDGGPLTTQPWQVFSVVLTETSLLTFSWQTISARPDHPLSLICNMRYIFSFCLRLHGGTHLTDCHFSPFVGEGQRSQPRHMTRFGLSQNSWWQRDRWMWRENKGQSISYTIKHNPRVLTERKTRARPDDNTIYRETSGAIKSNLEPSKTWVSRKMNRIC